VPRDDREARVAWSRITEPGDLRATALVRSEGPRAALAVAQDGRCPGWERLQPRLELLDLERDRHIAQRIGARVLIPGDPDWPAGVDDLDAPPHCLWVRGARSLGRLCERSAAVVGARSATAYGENVAADMAAGLCDLGFTVVSGAAFGIDAAAHRGVLAVGGDTVAVLAGGVERPYPAAHSSLLARIAEEGLVVSEVPPGSAPTRSRFIQRNRLIATMTQGTIVVEAGLRSGSLNTAGTAAEHFRVVAAVPGPVSSMVSAGCHQAIRDGTAVLVTDAAEAAEAIGGIGADLAPAKRGPERPGDGATPAEAAVLACLPFRAAVTAQDLALRTTLPARDVLAALGQLELGGLAAREGDRWRQRRPAAAEEPKRERERRRGASVGGGISSRAGS
jgi:DNA processing protein